MKYKKQGHERLKNWRRKEFNKNKICKYCDCEMILPYPLPKGDKTPDNACTVNHKISKLHPLRGKLREYTWEICCYKCNNRLGREEEQRLPKEALRERSQRHPSKLRKQIQS